MSFNRKVLRDNIKGITKGDIRRLARRGGVKRISAMVYDETRDAVRERLNTILRQVCMILEFRQRKTVTCMDIIFVLNRLGSPLYGFGTTQYTDVPNTK
ncbi:hypothetical protein EJ08DRAFT_695371 [Tothia fuscella]|uniref:Histone H4 n=1 Tax=Tothia fuscella TaxID=1048955 RepID=A0A9P4NVX6_9PEZI|nr:hypothetical protein EJ08DRAFT_695371 [Tothia fuscella]